MVKVLWLEFTALHFKTALDQCMVLFTFYFPLSNYSSCIIVSEKYQGNVSYLFSFTHAKMESYHIPGAVINTVALYPEVPSTPGLDLDNEVFRL